MWRTLWLGYGERKAHRVFFFLSQDDDQRHNGTTKHVRRHHTQQAQRQQCCICFFFRVRNYTTTTTTLKKETILIKKKDVFVFWKHRNADFFSVPVHIACTVTLCTHCTTCECVIARRGSTTRKNLCGKRRTATTGIHVVVNIVRLFWCNCLCFYARTMMVVVRCRAAFLPSIFYSVFYLSLS